MAKVIFSKGLSGRLLGGALGGAASAVFDRYVTPMLGSQAGNANYIKIAAGVALPMLVKGNQMVTSIADGMITVGVDKLVSGMLPVAEDDPSTSGVGAGRYASYRKYANKQKVGTKVGAKVANAGESILVG